MMSNYSVLEKIKQQIEEKRLESIAKADLYFKDGDTVCENWEGGKAFGYKDVLIMFEQEGL